MPRWLLWSLVALLSWGVWAILSKLIGDALSAAHSQALSTLGLLPVMVALGFSGRLSATGHRLRGTLCALRRASSVAPATLRITTRLIAAAKRPPSFRSRRFIRS